MLVFCLMLTCCAALAAPAPAELLKSAMESTEKIDSVRLEFAVNAGAEGMLPASDVVSGSVSIIKQPLKVKAEGNVPMMGLSAQAYAEQVGDEVRIYTNTDGSWVTPGEKVSAAQVISALDLTQLTGELDKLGNLAVADATESIDGKDAYKLTAKVDLREMGAADAIDSALAMALGQLGVAATLSKDAPLTFAYALYVEAESGRLLRLEADLSDVGTAVFAAVMASQPGAPSTPQAVTLVISVDIKDYNAVTDFEIPAEAKALDPVA
jgi:hypothetical protein